MCSEDDFACYFVFEICLFRLDSSGHLLPCKKGEHLQQCEDYECNLEFKCSHYYCIPWSYSCDRKWDCAFGADESEANSCGRKRSCAMLFSCRNSHLCIHKMSICNHIEDCPVGDDEQMCLLHNTTCPSWWNCLTFPVVCHQELITPNELSVLSVFRVLYFNNITLSLSSFDSFSSRINIISIRHSLVPNLCKSLRKSSKVLLLDVQFSKNLEVSSNCIAGMVSILVIKLNDNNLKWICQYSFQSLPKLQFLNISNNLLHGVQQNAFENMPQLKLLSILNIVFKGENMLNNLQNLNFQLLLPNTQHISMLNSDTIVCLLCWLVIESRDKICLLYHINHTSVQHMLNNCSCHLP